PTRFTGAGSSLGGASLCYAAPYFGPVTRDIVQIRNNPASFWGIIVPAEPSPSLQVVSGRSTPPGLLGDAPVRIADVRDGTSNTILLGEKWLRPDQYTTGAWNDDHNLVSSLDQDEMRVGDQVPLRDTVTNPFTGATVAPGDNNPCCDYWRDPDNRLPSPRL